MPIFSYRPEIDGLRAIAVIGVVLFHANLGFSGGYIGVDVFFVISGYLITQIIVKEIYLQKFTLADFWARRIKRILPAVSVMNLFVIFSAYFFFLSNDFSSLLNSSIAQILMVPNIYFWRQSGYFSDQSILIPLLHTWSLGIEEQFYLFFPATLIFLTRYLKRYLFPIFAAIMFISLSLSIYFTTNSSSLAFYLLPTRAWELLAGAILVVGNMRAPKNNNISQVFSIAGICSIFLAMVFFSNKLSFPGAYPLLPVVGTMAIIVGCSGKVTYVGKILSTRPFVFTGMISYSLYLYHWPLFVFAEHFFIEMDQYIRVGVIIVSFILAYLSWKYIEKPFRQNQSPSKQIYVYSFGALTIFALLMISGSMQIFGTISNRADPKSLVFEQDIAWTGKGGTYLHIGEKQATEKKRAPDFVLWGDSHARVVVSTIDVRAAKLGLVGEAYLSNGTIPIPGLWRPSSTKQKQKKYLDLNETILQSIIRSKIRNVILVSRWNVNCAGRNKAEIFDGVDKSQSLVVDEIETSELEPDSDMARRSIERQLRRMLHRLEQSETTVWLFMQVPETSSKNTARDFVKQMRFPKFNNINQFSTTLDKHLQRQKCFKSVIDELGHKNLVVIDSTNLFFDNSKKALKVYSERSYYRDDDHLTQIGVEKFVAGLFEKILLQIRARQVL